MNESHEIAQSTRQGRSGRSPVCAAQIEARVAQLVGEMITEGWDRKTATAIAREFAKAGA